MSKSTESRLARIWRSEKAQWLIAVGIFCFTIAAIVTFTVVVSIRDLAQTIWQIIIDGALAAWNGITTVVPVIARLITYSPLGTGTFVVLAIGSGLALQDLVRDHRAGASISRRVKVTATVAGAIWGLWFAVFVYPVVA